MEEAELSFSALQKVMQLRSESYVKDSDRNVFEECQSGPGWHRGRSGWVEEGTATGDMTVAKRIAESRVGSNDGIDVGRQTICLAGETDVMLENR